jgi:hypothetical protein
MRYSAPELLLVGAAQNLVLGQNFCLGAYDNIDNTKDFSEDPCW